MRLLRAEAMIAMISPLRKTMIFVPLALMACTSLPKQAGLEPSVSASFASEAGLATRDGIHDQSGDPHAPLAGGVDAAKSNLGLDPTAEPDLKAEDFEEGFCADDIYAKHLTKQYRAQNPHLKRPSAPLRRRGSSRQVVRGHELAALSYARQRMQGGTPSYFGAIPVVVNRHVDFWVQYYKSSGRRDFFRWLVRGESIRRVVQPILQETGVPLEFFYLAMVESGFSNHAYSHKRATGTWQFMSGTAQGYGLRINHWVDERRDPIKSTLAAASYLRDLYNDFGDWHLAMAAYNAGPGRVRRAIRQAGTKDFWKIADTRHLSKETRNYVPKVLAAIMLAAEAKGHGFNFKGNPIDSLPESEVIVKRPIKLEELATALGISVRTIKRWNPELLRDVVPPMKNGYALRLSSVYASVFPTIEQKLSLIDITDIQIHTIRAGDTLSQIAKKYNCAIKQILSLNPDLKPNRLRIGHAVAVPVPGVISRS